MLTISPFNNFIAFSPNGKQISVDESSSEKERGLSTEKIKKERRSSIYKKRHYWTKSEDIKLLAAVQELGERNWKLIASKYFDNRRKDSQCSSRYHRISNTTINKGPWTQSEKEKMLKLESKLSTHQWKQIASHYFPDRTSDRLRQEYKKQFGLETNLVSTSKKTKLNFLESRKKAIRNCQELQPIFENDRPECSDKETDEDYLLPKKSFDPLDKFQLFKFDSGVYTFEDLLSTYPFPEIPMPDFSDFEEEVLD